MRGDRRLAARLWIAALAMLTAFTVYTAVHYYPSRSSIDLYHPWGIVQAHEALGRATNPYTDTARYGAHIYALAGAIPDSTLRYARGFWRSRGDTGIEPTGTPLFYSAHFPIPRGFQSFRLLHAWLAYAAIVAAVLLLARLRGAHWLAALCAAALVAGTFNPFLDSVFVGNVGAMQVAALAAMIALAQWRTWERRAWVDRGYLAMLALIVLLKPNAIFIAAGLAAHYAVVRGTRRFLAGSAIAAAVTLVAVAVSSAYFGSASVWLEWLRYLQGANGGTLEYSFDQGNIALPVFMFEHTDWIAPQTWSTMFAATFALVLLAYATSEGREPHRLVPVARAWLADPWIAASVPALAMFAASPLLWPHYLVFALIPLAWLAAGSRDWTAACAVASFLGMSLFLSGPLVVADLKDLVKPAMSFAWTLMLPAAVARLSRAARAVPG